jgi:hypothetical protein
MINNIARNRTVVVPQDIKEKITLIQYQPGHSILIQVEQGIMVDGEFHPHEFSAPETYTLAGDGLVAMLGDEEVETAVSALLGKCWEQIDLKRGIEND